MSTVSPKIRAQFESMPIDLKNHILSMDVKLENMNDLMAVLERIVAAVSYTHLSLICFCTSTPQPRTLMRSVIISLLKMRP